MHDLQPHGADTHRAEQPQTPPAFEIRLLRGVEIKEPQVNMAGAVAHAADKAAPPAKNHVGQLDFAHDHRLHAGSQTADGRDAGAVLIAEGKMKQDVLHRAQAEALELLRELGTDAFEGGYGQRGDVHKYQYSPQRRKG